MKSKRAREAATAVEDLLPVDDAPVEKKRKRGDDEPTEVKQKKAKKGKKDKKDKKDKKESRKEKKDKRKNLQDLPGEEEQEQEQEEQNAADTDTKESQAPDMSDEKPDEKPKKEKKEKKEEKEEKEEKQKKEKKEKKEKKRTEEANGDDSNTHKKEKDKKKKKSKDETSSTQDAAPTPSSPAQAAKPSRFIVFIGNLPFTATADSIKAHFASLKPTSVRCMKNKDDDKPCRGIAFVEFANVSAMRTCLDKFHHTEFEGRKINVELTAGGGGKTKFRKDKIFEKNKKLDENRSKRMDKERAAKEESGGKSGGKTEDNVAGIHPSRLARNPRLGE